MLTVAIATVTIKVSSDCRFTALREVCYAECMNTPELCFATGDYPKSHHESVLQRTKKPMIHLGTGNCWYGKRVTEK